MKYYIIAGEASGDLHGANLIKEIRALDRQADIRAWGGELMQQQGATLVKHYRDLAFMGFVEVLTNLLAILGNFRFCRRDILEFQPNVVILIDYPGFNLRMAKFAHAHHIKVVYYISPQVWAWKKGRVKTIRKVVDKMMVILPFEKDFYKKSLMEVDFVGHPLLDAIQNTPVHPDFRRINHLDHRPIVALLPGSRLQEIGNMLSLMLKTAVQFPDIQFVVAAAPSVEPKVYQQMMGAENVKVVYDQTYALLQQASAALVTSGTATLETALFGIPQVVCYKGNRISYAIARRIVDIRFISLVNLIMDKEVVKELIQNDLTVENMITALKEILPDGVKRQEILSDYRLLKEKLGGTGASQRAARIIVNEVLQADNEAH